ncbi:ComEA family DNA-binding protein [Candidatus Omnitrophota bacterium]
MNLAKQEITVLFFLGCVAVAGIGLHAYTKAQPDLQDILDHVNTRNKINVNTASIEKLMKIQHVTPRLAYRIVAHRKETGSFKSFAAVQDVLDVTNKELEDIQRVSTIE